MLLLYFTVGISTPIDAPTAHKTLVQNLSTIASCEIDVLVLVQKLYSYTVIKRDVYRFVSDRLTGLSNDERLQHLLRDIVTTVRYDGDQFVKVLVSLKECGQEELVHKLTCDYGKNYSPDYIVDVHTVDFT